MEATKDVIVTCHARTNHDNPTIPGPQPRSFPLLEGVVECGDGQVVWLPANNRWPISVTSHHLALPRLLLRGCWHYATIHDPMASNVCMLPAEGNQGGVVPIPAGHASVLSLQAVYTQRTVWPVSLRPIRHSGGLGRLLRMGLAPFLRQSHAKLQSPIPVTQSPSFGVRLTSRSSGPKHQHPHLTFLTSLLL